MAKKRFLERRTGELRASVVATALKSLAIYETNPVTHPLINCLRDLPVGMVLSEKCQQQFRVCLQLLTETMEEVRSLSRTSTLPRLKKELEEVLQEIKTKISLQETKV